MRIAILLLFLTPLYGADKFSWREASDKSIELLDDGKPVFAYNYGMILKQGVPAEWARSSYVHPLYAPNGAVLTDDFPLGHLDHRGVSWMWPVVKFDGVRRDLWYMDGIHQEFVRWLKKDPGFLSVENAWVVEGKHVVREIVDIRAQKLKGKTRDLDFRISLEALEKPVTLQGEPENQVGNGGFNIRFAERQHTAIRTLNSANEPDSDLKVREYAELVGDFGDKRAGARITIDKANPGAPNGWYLRKYGFLGVCYPGNGTHELVPGKPLILKYRVTVFSE